MLPTGMEEKKEITGYSMIVSFSERSITCYFWKALHSKKKKRNRARRSVGYRDPNLVLLALFDGVVDQQVVRKRRFCVGVLCVVDGRLGRALGWWCCSLLHAHNHVKWQRRRGQEMMTYVAGVRALPSVGV
jgi:hypothetical protein